MRLQESDTPTARGASVDLSLTRKADALKWTALEDIDALRQFEAGRQSMCRIAIHLRRN